MSLWKAIALLCCITFCVYFPSFFNPFIWDDEQFIYNNNYVKNFDVFSIFTENTIAGAGEQSHYFRPLTTLSFAFDYAVWGDTPFGYHLVNTLLHISCGVLLSIYLSLLKVSKKIILFVVSIFLLHPIQTEAVTYINSRGDSLYTLFLLSSLLSYIYFIKDKIFSLTIYDLKLSFHSTHLYIFSIITFFCSILSKELGIAGIGLFILTALFLNIKKYSKKNVLFFFSLLGVLGLYALARLSFWNFSSGYQVDLEASPYFANTWIRFLTAFKIYWLYLGILFFPFPLHMERMTEIVNTLFNPWVLATFVLIFLMFYVSYKEYKRNNKQTFVAFGFLWFSGLFIPISGIIPSVGMLYEHWLYLPLVGCTLCIAFLVEIYLKQFEIIKKIYLPLLSILIFIVSLLTLYQNYLWGDHIRFYTYTLQFNQTARLHNNLAMAYAEKNDLDNAITQYHKAIQIGDWYPQTHYNLANALATQKKFDEALQEYDQSIKLNKYFYLSYIKSINILIDLKRYPEAEEKSTLLLELDPENAEFNLIHGYTLLLNSKLSEAKVYFDKAIVFSEDQRMMKQRVEALN